MDGYLKWLEHTHSNQCVIIWTAPHGSASCHAASFHAAPFYLVWGNWCLFKHLLPSTLKAVIGSLMHSLGLHLCVLLFSSQMHIMHVSHKMRLR